MAYFTTDMNKKIYYEHHAGGKHAVVLIHGWGMSLRVWDTTLKWLLANGFEVLAFDQRGCGMSDKDFPAVTIDQLAQDCVALVNACKIKKPVLNGWSLGGAVAVNAAARLGANCAGVISTCGATPRYTQTDGFPYGGMADDVAATVDAMRADRATFFHGLSRAVCAKPVGQAVEDWMWSIFMQTAPCADNALFELANLDQRDVLAGLSVPFLSIVGSLDGFTAADIGRAAATLAKSGELVEFADVGHAPFAEVFDDYIAALGGFLAKL